MFARLHAWGKITIQSRCNRSLSFGSKCHYSTRSCQSFSLSLFMPRLHQNQNTLFFAISSVGQWLLVLLVLPLPPSQHIRFYQFSSIVFSHFHAIILPLWLFIFDFGHFSYVVVVVCRPFGTFLTFILISIYLQKSKIKTFRFIGCHYNLARRSLHLAQTAPSIMWFVTILIKVLTFFILTYTSI